MDTQFPSGNGDFESAPKSFTSSLRRAAERIRSSKYPEVAGSWEEAQKNEYSLTSERREELWEEMVTRISRSSEADWRSSRKIPERYERKYSNRFRTITIGLGVVFGLSMAALPAVREIFSHNRALITDIVYATRAGQQAEVQLGEGSTALINVSSSLSYDPQTRGKERRFSLSGEAFFSVRDIATSPFVVSTEHSMVSVLGTEFKVRNYSFEEAAQVAVKTGRVNASGVVLDAGKAITSRMSDAFSSKNRSDKIEYKVKELNSLNIDPFAFTEKKLAINGLTLAEAVPLLEQWFDIDIQVPIGTINDRRMTGVFPLNSLSNLSVILEGTINVKVLQDGRTVVIIPAN